MADLRGFAKRSSSFFVARSKPNGAGRPRFAVVVGIKVDARAAERHKFKRWVAGYLIRQGYGGEDLVVALLPAAAKLKKKAFLEELAKVT